MEWKSKCCGKLVHLLIVDGEPSALFYNEKELCVLVHEMGYNNTRVIHSRVITNGKKAAHNRKEWNKLL